jgi:Calx-beta domain-containing protein/concanavalin A-like lectin/glucanase superfamily protein
MTKLAWLRLLGVFLAMLPPLASANSLRFFGNGVGDIDRAKIQVDDPATSSAGPPADIGATSFTIEFWIKGVLAENRGTVRCGSTYGWIEGNTVIDRDRYDQPRSFGIALGNGRVAFGTNVANWSTTLCGTRNVLDGTWHHVAVTRERDSGVLRIFVDGQPDGTANGAPGDISYPDNGVPGNYCGGSCAFSDPYLVIGAEKHDAGNVRYPSFRGLVDELRLSTVSRYSGNFVVPTVPFVADTATAALYHLDESAGTAVRDAVGASPGFLRVGGNPVGPVWSSDSPFAATGAGTLALQAASYSGSEATGTITVTVERTGGSSGSASVTYQTGVATATPGADYQPATGTLNWSDGDAQPKSFTIVVLDDATDEPDETLTVLLTGASGASLGSPSSATLTILDNDATLQHGTLRFANASYSIVEGGGSVAVIVNRVGGTDGAVSVNFATGTGSALADADFTTDSGTLYWPAGDASNRVINIPILQDAIAEGVENFTVTLAAPDGGAALGVPSATTVSIADDDAVPTAGSVRFSSAGYTVAEGEGMVTLTVNRVSGTAGTIAVNYATSNGSATSGSDFSARAGTLSWGAGDSSSRTIVVPILADTAIEDTEAFSVSLSAPTGGALLTTPSVAAVSITDDDVPPLAGGFSDGFERPSGAALGNGWVERDPNAFSLSSGQALKNSSSGVGGDALVYRPATENATDVEVAAQLRLTAAGVGYPQVFSRLQTAGIGTTGPVVRYVLYIDASAGSAVLARELAGGLTTLANIGLSPRITTTEAFRLRLRTTGTSPVAIGAFVERSVAGSWQIIGQATVTDSSSSRISAAGSTGFGGYRENGYSFDNFTRTMLTAPGALGAFSAGVSTAPQNPAGR